MEKHKNHDSRSFLCKVINTIDQILTVFDAEKT